MATKYSHNIDGTLFNIEDNAIKPFPKLTHSSTDIESGNIKKLINAVEIDWNGAKPGIGEDQTTGITTTGELLSRIKGVYSPMFAN